MRSPSKMSYFATGAATLALLAGCSSASGITTTSSDGGVTQQNASRFIPMQRLSTSYSVLPPNVHVAASAFHPFVSSGTPAKATGDTVAISDQSNNVVDIFTAQGHQTRQLTGFSYPQGMASDINGDLFVADTVNNRVQVYAANFKGKPTTLSDPGQYPSGVDSFDNGEYVAVTNIISTSEGPGSVSIFKGATLQNTISSPSLARAYFCAFDATGNLFVDGQDSNSNTVIGEIANATSGGTKYAALTTRNSITFPGGVEVTTSGQIAIADQDSEVLYTYNPPSKGSLGSPTQTTVLSRSSDPVSFAFTKNMRSIYTADARNVSNSNQYVYPAGGSPISSIRIRGGVPDGVAVIPTQYPEDSK